jgi:hypothetical protein
MQRLSSRHPHPVTAATSEGLRPFGDRLRQEMPSTPARGNHAEAARHIVASQLYLYACFADMAAKSARRPLLSTRGPRLVTGSGVARQPLPSAASAAAAE